MAFDYTKKLTNPADYPTVPADENEARQQFMDLFDEIKDAHNTLDDKTDEHLADMATDTDGAHGLKIEEGNWTPVIRGESTVGNPTYTNQIGKYYKIGNKIHLECQITITNKGGMTGKIRIDGLPFVTKNNNLGSAAINIYSGFNLGTGYTTVGLAVASNLMFFLKSGSNVVSGQIVDTEIADSLSIRFSAEYYTN